MVSRERDRTYADGLIRQGARAKRFRPHQRTLRKQLGRSTSPKGGQLMGTSIDGERKRNDFARANEILSIEPRGLDRAKAAAYVGVSPSLFDEMISDGRMPPPKVVNTRRIWDRRELDSAFDAL